MSIYQFNPEDAKRFAREQGIRVSERGDELQFQVCPYCKRQTTKTYKFAINLQTGAFNCLRASCGAKGNMLTLARDFNFSLGRDVDEYYSHRKTYRNLAKYPRPEVRTPAIEYMESRGISKEIAERFSITTQKEHDNILVFPFFDENSRMQFVKYRKTDFDKEKDSAKEWCESNCKPILFGMDQCNAEQNKTLILTEGQIDSLSVIEAGIDNAVSVPTGAKGFTWVPYCWDFLGEFDTLIVFGDHENGKITLLEEMQQRFHGNVKHVRPEDYRGCKDANELLRKYGARAVRDAVLNAIPTENPRIKSLDEYERLNTADMEHFTTGFRELDRTIGGFWFGQLIILTGERGDGKSTLASQFGLTALSNGYTVFCYSGELRGSTFQEWFDQQAAGPDHVNTLVSNLDYTTYKVDGQYIDRIHQWYHDRFFLYDNTFVDDPEEDAEALIITLEDAIKKNCCRVLIIDNLMTAMQDDLSADLYRQQTKFVRALSLLAKKYNVLIFLIAHPRKTFTGKFKNDDVAGSANITNLADVVIRYARPGSDYEGPADRLLQVEKNRLSGRLTRDGIELYYNEPSKRISEGAFDWRAGWEDSDQDGFVPVGDMNEIPF